MSCYKPQCRPNKLQQSGPERARTFCSTRCKMCQEHLLNQRAWHKFIWPVPCNTSCLLFVFFNNSDLVVSRPKIQLWEPTSLTKLIKQVSNEWNGVLVLRGHLVQCSIVDTHIKRAIFLLLKEDWCIVRGFRGLDIPCSIVCRALQVREASCDMKH